MRRNPFQLGFEALREMKTALTGMMISYRLIDPSCPYSWDRKFFETNIITDKDAEGRTVVKFNRIRRISFRLPLPKNLLPTGSFIARMTITASVP